MSQGRRSEALIAACIFVSIVFPNDASAIDCPKNPEQARKDWEVAVRAAVGKIGPAHGAELETLTRSTTRDLVGKLPQADKVYLEQMMYATYCSALRDDPSLTEAERRSRIRSYNLEVRNTLRSSQQPSPDTLAAPSASNKARKELQRLSIEYEPGKFIESAGSGDLATVKLFLAAGMNPNESEWNSTPLIAASCGGHLEVIDALLKAGANVNKTNPGDSTALDCAVEENRESALKRLLDNGANRSTINKALLTAAKSGNLALFETLLKRGPDTKLLDEALRKIVDQELNQNDEKRANEVLLRVLELGAKINQKDKQDEEGFSPLITASRNGNTLLVQTLLKHGADVNSTSNKGWTALHAASQAGFVSTVRVLLDAGASINMQDDSGWSALLIATAASTLADKFKPQESSEHNRKAVVDLLLARGADPKLANNIGKTTLMMAAERGDVNTVKTLLNMGIDVNAKSKDGFTPLMWAASGKNQVDTIRILLDHGADLNAKAGDGTTALMDAAMESDPESLKVLRDAGADLHARDNYGMTALMLAVRKSRAEQVRFLLRMGAKANDEDANGKTVLEYAEAYDDPVGKEVIRILTRAGAK